MTIAEVLGIGFSWMRALPAFLWRTEARLKGIECHRSVLFSGRPIIARCDGSRMIISEGVRVNSALRSNSLGCFQPTSLRTVGVGAKLILGRNVGVSAAVIFAGNSIEIGEGTIVGIGAMILDNDFHVPCGEWGWRGEYVSNSRPISIGKGVFIGSRAIILKGVTIGDRAVIGAGSVVTRDVPSGMLAAGNPAKIIGPVTKHPEIRTGDSRMKS